MDWQPIIENFPLDTACEVINFHILCIAKKHIPNKLVTIRPNDKPWFNGYLRRLNRYKLRAFRKFKQDKSSGNWIKFQEIRRLYDRELKRIKNEHKQSYFKKNS